MSQWGKLDRFVIPGTVTANLGNYGVSFSQSQTANIAIGYALVLGNVEYIIANVVNSANVTLDVPYEAANTQGAVSFAAVQQSPKSLRTYGWGGEGAANLLLGANTVNARNVFGLDAKEANVKSNKDRGFNSPGWVHYQTWVNSQGTTRYRTETLVAMSKNFNKSNVDFNIGVDANEDATIQDNQLSFSLQPTVDGQTTANLQFTPAMSYQVLAVGTNGAVPTYKWQKSPNTIVWADVIDRPYTGNAQFYGNTTANLAISNVYATTNTIGIYLRVLASANAAATITSDTIRVLG
jgi:hypothetical protein